MRIHLTELNVGDRLSAEVFNPNGIHVLPAAKELTEEDINKLTLHKVEYVDIVLRTAEKDSLVTSKKPQITQQILPHFNQTVDGVISLFDQVNEQGKFDDNLVNSNLEPLVESFKAERDVVSLLLELNSKDDYTYQHSVQVGMISFFIAKWLGKSDIEAYQIGKAGYLHDIGKSKINSSILNKPEKLTDQEFEEIKKHTLYGYDIVAKSLDDKSLAFAVLQHHERSDGSGYPHGLKSDKIHPFAKIIAIADIYSAMISSRVYQKKSDLLIVLKELHHLSFQKIDPFITQTFIRNMIPNFIGKRVSLKSGESGIIVLNNPHDFFRPLIQLQDTFIDLSSQCEYEIEMIYV